MSNLEFIVTGDGSHSLLNKELNETYHSVHGALRESLHVFIKHGLEFFSERYPELQMRVFEVGFGTGLNALLALQAATELNLNVSYTSLELFPLTEEVWRKLNYAETDLSKKNFEKIHNAPWFKQVDISSNFSLLKIQGKLQEVHLAQSSYDVIFFDAFAPNKQPEMWTLPVLEKVISMMDRPGVFVTYCAKGQLKRDLKNLGLVVETLEGPPGKKEMVRGVKEK